LPTIKLIVSVTLTGPGNEVGLFYNAHELTWGCGRVKRSLSICRLFRTFFTHI